MASYAVKSIYIYISSRHISKGGLIIHVSFADLRQQPDWSDLDDRGREHEVDSSQSTRTCLGCRQDGQV